MSSQTVQQLALNNELFVKQLDSALMSANLPPNTLRTMIENVNKTFECDAKCQEKKKISDLYGKWMNAKSIESSSQKKLKDARANYFKAANGEQYYRDNISIPEYKKEINAKIKEYQDELTKTKHINDRILDAYSVSFTSFDRIKQLHQETKDKNKKLKKKLDKILKTTNTEERKVWYKFESIDRQKYYNKIIFWIYYTIIVLWSIMQLFVNKTFKNLNFWIKFIVLIIFPFIIKYIIKFIYYILHYFRMVS
jgi:hypothetical protein